MLFRNDRSSKGTSKKEVEANSFAAELLMPEDNVRDEVAKFGDIDLENEEALSNLAEKYGVSKTAITVRLTSLYLAH